MAELVDARDQARFSPDGYRQLHTATEPKIRLAKSYIEDYEDLHNYVSLMVNTALRPDETNQLELREPKNSSHIKNMVDAQY